MVKDRKAIKTGDNAPFYALKVQKSAEHYTEAAMDEVELLDCISTERKKAEQEMANGASKHAAITVERSRFVATLHDSFFHSGPNGRHMCMVFSMLGCNLLTVIKAFNYRGIPIDAVKVMIRGVCKGLDFLHRKCQIIHTDLKPENVLLQFPHQIDQDEELTLGVAALALEDYRDNGRNAIGTSIEDLEAALKDLTLSQEQKKQIKKRLKRKRQKEKKRTFISNDENSNDDEGESASSTLEEDVTLVSGNSSSYILSDDELKMLINKLPQKEGGSLESHSRVKRRLEHNRFLATNFGPHSGLTRLAADHILARKADNQELQDFFHEAGDGGIAKVCILMRKYSTEEELAKSLCTNLGGISFDNVGQDREWSIRLTISKVESSAHTYLKLSQRMSLEMADLQYFTDLVELVGENFNMNDQSNEPGSPDITAEIVPGSSAVQAFSVLYLQCPTMSTLVGLSFLESKLPGVAFLTYRRDDGVPSLDNLVFGHQSDKICEHPLAMRIGDNLLNPSSRQGSSIFGFDMRLVGAFGHSPVLENSGSYSFLLESDHQDLLQWWEARNSLQERIRCFSGIDPSNQIMNLVDQEGARESRRSTQDTGGFQEGEKKAPVAEILTAPSSREASTTSLSPSITHTPDLKDTKMLTACRSVIVDLGNACWTYRHFSEDIQTRQYRAPEVLIGSKYDTSADIWSLGCMVFELLTGDLLFDPRAGDDYDRDEDHLAMFQELLGQMPKRLALDGKYSKNFFDKKGNLRHIKQLKFWPMEDVLSEKYHFPREEAQAIADFVRPLLDFDPKTRMTAEQALQSKWLQSIP